MADSDEEVTIRAVKVSETPSERRKREAAEARQRMTEEERRKREEKDRKKAEVRKRLEEASKAKNAKKGFMTPERKKKLRMLLRKMAAEELKKEQERKAEERRNTIKKRCGEKKNIDGANEGQLKSILQDFHKRLEGLEDKKYDLEYEVRQKDFQINELTIQVNDLRGKFVKPTLKKISKYEAKFDKLKQVARSQEVDFRATLKSTNKNKFALTDETKPKDKPEWALGAQKETETEA